MSEAHCKDEPTKIVDPTISDQKRSDPKIMDPIQIIDRLKNRTFTEILEEGLEKLLRWFIFWESIIYRLIIKHKIR